MSVGTVNGTASLKSVVANRLANVGKPAAERRVITPVEAKEFLERSKTRNRKINQTKVNVFAQSMSLGKWQYNAQTISFDKDGNIINGHHRLMACVQSDCPFETLVAYNVDPTSMATVDVGTVRTPTHVLQIAGHKNASDKSSLLKMIWHWETGSLSYCHKSGIDAGYTHETMLEVAERHPEADEAITQSHTLYGQFRACPRVFYAFGLSCLTVYDRDLAVEFCERLADGAELSRSSPIFLLRKKFIDDQTSRAKLPIRDRLAFFLKAWRAFATGTTVKVLRFGEGEEFPNPDPTV